MAIGVLTATSAVPSGTRIFPSVPSSTASTSMVALSVSISAMTSPGEIFSPSFFTHLARLPFSMVGDNAGISTWIGMGGLSGKPVQVGRIRDSGGAEQQAGEQRDEGLVHDACGSRRSGRD